MIIADYKRQLNQENKTQVKYLICYYFLGILFTCAFVWVGVWQMNESLKLSDKVYCLKLARQSVEFKDKFFMTKLQSDMCVRSGVSINAKMI